MEVNMTLEEEARQAPENLRNQSIIADALKQMVLVIISLGFSNAFLVLVKPDDKVLHLFNAACGAEPKGCPLVQWDNLLIFLLYILVGTRFLLTNWLYLSTTYRDNNRNKLHISPDAIGIFLTGVLIGMQSSYASPGWMPDFFLVFSLVLLADTVASIVSIGLNWQVVKHEGLRQELWWTGNNLFFCVATSVLLVSHPPYNSTSWPGVLLMVVAFLNSLISLVITWLGYFRTNRVAWPVCRLPHR
jgi:hypothetical protein